MSKRKACWSQQLTQVSFLRNLPSWFLRQCLLVTHFSQEAFPFSRSLSFIYLTRSCMSYSKMLGQHNLLGLTQRLTGSFFCKTNLLGWRLYTGDYTGPEVLNHGIVRVGDTPLLSRCIWSFCVLEDALSNWILTSVLPLSLINLKYSVVTQLVKDSKDFPMASWPRIPGVLHWPRTKKLWEPLIGHMKWSLLAKIKNF